MNPFLVHPESFPATPRKNFRIVAAWPPRGFGIGFALPRVALHHSCFASLIVASPGVIKLAIPAGIFSAHVTAILVTLVTYERPPGPIGGTSGRLRQY